MAKLLLVTLLAFLAGSLSFIQAVCDPTAWTKCTAPTSESEICSYLKCIVDRTSDCDDTIKKQVQAVTDAFKEMFPSQTCGVGPSFSQSTTEDTTRTAWPATAITNSHPTATARATAQNTTRQLSFSQISNTTTGPQSTTLSEYDTVNKLWYQLTYCDYIGYRGKCDVYKSTLLIALDHHYYDNICSAAKNLMNCLDVNCIPSTDREDAIQQVRARCNGSTQATCDPTAWAKCTAPSSESDICSYLKCIEDGTSDCDDAIKNAAQAASDGFKQAFPGQDCEGWRFVNETSTPFTTPAVVTQSLSEPDALTSEWLTLTSCSFKETTETCAREKYTLEISRALHFEVCRNAYIFLECLEDRCQYSKELTRSIMKTRADCSATNKKLSQLNVVINNYIGGKAESRRAKNILEILGIYPDN